MKIKYNSFEIKTFSLALLVIVALTVSGCMNVGGRLTWHDIETGSEIGGEDPSDPEVPVDVPDDPDDGGIDIGSGGDDTIDDGDGSGAGGGVIPEIDFNFEDDPGEAMNDRQLTANFGDAVDNCGTPAADDFIDMTDEAGNPIECAYAWNGGCTELRLTPVTLDYLSLYNVYLRAGLSINGNVIEEDLQYSFLTPANYFSADGGAYGDYPVSIRENQWIFNRQVRVYLGDDLLPEVTPRNPLSFGLADVIQTFTFQPPDGAMSEKFVYNLGEGRFMLYGEDGIGTPTMYFWNDLAEAAMELALPAPLWDFGYTDQSSSSALGFNGNSVQDFVIQVLDFDTSTYHVSAFYDWPDEVAMDYAAPDWDVTFTHDTNATDYIDTGDINGDGYSDVCILGKDPLIDWTRYFTIYCYYGGDGGLSAVPDLTIQSPNWWSGFGMQLGDVNCDGYDDIVVRGRFLDVMVTGEYTERVWVFPAGADVTGYLTIENDIDPALTIDGPVGDFFIPFHRFGWILDVGDVDGDSCADIFASQASARVLAYKGDSSIMYGSPQTIAYIDDADIVFEDLSVQYQNFIHTYMDLNGDGYRDFVYSERWGDLSGTHNELFFRAGGADFFGEDQLLLQRADADALFDYLVEGAAH